MEKSFLIKRTSNVVLLLQTSFQMIHLLSVTICRDSLLKNSLEKKEFWMAVFVKVFLTIYTEVISSQTSKINNGFLFK